MQSRSGSGVTGIGTGGASPEPEYQIQNRFSEGDDIVLDQGRPQPTVRWVRRQSSVRRLLAVSRQFGVDLREPPAVPGGNRKQSDGSPEHANNYPIRNYREIDFVFYGAGRLEGHRSRLSVNLGLRYEPMTNPMELHDELYTITNFATATSFTQVPTRDDHQSVLEKFRSARRLRLRSVLGSQDFDSRRVRHVP